MEGILVENVRITLDDGTGRAFDEALEGALAECQDVTLITKNRATANDKPAVMVTFGVRLPDGSIQRAQAVMPLRLFLRVAQVMMVRYPDLLEDWE